MRRTPDTRAPPPVANTPSAPMRARVALRVDGIDAGRMAKAAQGKRRAPRPLGDGEPAWLIFERPSEGGVRRRPTGDRGHAVARPARLTLRADGAAAPWR